MHHQPRAGLDCTCTIGSLLSSALLSFWRHEEANEGDFSLVPVGSTWKSALFTAKHWYTSFMDPCGRAVQQVLIHVGKCHTFTVDTSTINSQNLNVGWWILLPLRT